MKSIVTTVIFCGQNNIPLRGKRDDNPDDSNLQGNLQALLEFRFDSGDVRTFLHFQLKTNSATKQFVLPPSVGAWKHIYMANTRLDNVI